MFKLAKWAVGKGCGGRNLRPGGRGAFAFEGLEGRRMLAGFGDVEVGDFSLNVSFPDANLESAVRAELNQPSGPITIRDMGRLTKLEYGFAPSDKKIKDLFGLQFASNLEYLFLHSNQITDISPLAGLTKLEELHLQNNRIMDIGPLAGLGSLEFLWLGTNLIEVIPSLEGLSSLHLLNLSSNSIEDLTELGYLPSLEHLDLSNNPIVDPAPLGSLTALEKLFLSGNYIVDISTLAGLARLRWFNVGANPISDISVVAGMPRLTDLDFSTTFVSDISALSGLANLISLSFSGTSATDLSPLTGFRRNALNLFLPGSDTGQLTHFDDVHHMLFHQYLDPGSKTRQGINGSPGNDLMEVSGKSLSSGANLRVNGPPGGQAASTSCSINSCSDIAVRGLDGDDVLELRGKFRVPFTFQGGAGMDMMHVVGNTLTSSPGDIEYAENLADQQVESVRVESGGKLLFKNSQDFVSLELKGASRAAVAEGGGYRLSLESLLLDPGAALDLTDGSLILNATPATREAQLATLTNLIASARSSGAWNGPGITSSLAAQSSGLTTLGILLNDDGTGHPVYTEFAGRSVGVNDILIKYTYAGDLDLNGVVDADDYFRIDSGFAAGGLVGGAHPTWSNGDINYDLKIDGDDYFLIDKAFAEQVNLLTGQFEILQ